METSQHNDDATKAAELERLRLEIAKLKEQTPWHDYIARFIPLVTAVVAVAGFIWGINQFNTDQESRATQLAADIEMHAETIANQRNELDKKTEQEFRKRFWEERLADYRQVTKLAATIAMSKAPQEVEDARSEFWVYYYGELSLIEDRDVFNAMVAFGQALHSFEQEPTSETEQLKRLSYKLARACRNSLKDTWEPITLVDFPQEVPGFK